MDVPDEPNPVRRAVALAGGPTKAAKACGVSHTAIYQWYDLGHVPRTYFAILLSKASGVPIEELAQREAS